MTAGLSHRGVSTYWFAARRSAGHRFLWTRSGARAISFYVFIVLTIAASRNTATASVDLVPVAPTGYGNCIPFANNVDFGFSGFIYRNVPAFVLNPGDSIRFDMADLNDVNIRRNIYLAPANINPAQPATCDDTEPSQGVTATAWTQVVADTQVPANPLGNLIQGDYELTYVAEASFNFPGGGLVVGFGGSPPGAYADANCEQLHVNVDCSDPSGFFYSRFFLRGDQSLAVLDDAVSVNDSRYHHLAGMRIIPVPVCGNGDVEAGEACDDSNVLNGDCCSSACQYEANGSPCPSDGNGCTDDQCDGAGTCGIPNTAPCDDTVFCNGTDTCSGGICTHAGNPCPGPDGDGNCSESCDETADACTGADPNGTACNDSSVCTPSDQCSEGSCTGPALNCNDNNLCTADSCHPVNGCVNAGAPAASCKTAQKSILILKQNGGAGDTQLFKWVKGEALDQTAHLGDPTGTTEYSVCIYKGASSDVLESFSIPPAGGNWSPIGDKGYKYKELNGSNGGITKVILKGGAASKTKVIVKGKGGNLPDPVLTNLPLPVTAQVINPDTGACVEAVFDTGSIKKNTDTLFKAKTP